MLQHSALFRFVTACFGGIFLAGMPVNAQTRIKVLWLGGGETSHKPAPMRDMLVPIFEKAGMAVGYRTNESVLNPDSLRNFDVAFIYNAKKGQNVDGTPDLTTAQEEALYNWVGAGHVVVGVHSANSSYLGNPRYLDLFGASFTSHGDGAGWKYISIVKPDHPALKGTVALTPVGHPTYWDEGRVHRFTKKDTVVLERARDAGVEKPWAWVRPEGKGWVYYNSSGHDERAWSDENFQKQMIQALKWGASVAQPTTALRGALSGLYRTTAAIPAGAGIGPGRIVDAIGATVGEVKHGQGSARPVIRFTVEPGKGK